MDEKEWLRPIEIQRLYGPSASHVSRDFASARQKEWVFCGRRCKLYLHADVKKILEERKAKQEKTKKRWKNRPDVLKGTKSKIKKVIDNKMYLKLSRAWFGMMRRCYTDERPDYKHYREFGITICDEWLNSFDEFALWSLNNGVEYELSLDRIDNNKGYSPDNCRWTSRKNQNRNTSANVNVTYKGETKTIADWAEKFGMKYHTLYARIISNEWDIEKAFNKTVREFHLITYQGKTQTVGEWAKELGFSYGTLLNRYKRGWPTEKIFDKTKYKSNSKPKSSH